MFGKHVYESPLLKKLNRIRRQIKKRAKDEGFSISESLLSDKNLIRRIALKQCIFGVDVNPLAVELSKVSLWLHTFTTGAPLSFLDHHLKTGNSLIGTTPNEFEDLLHNKCFSALQKSFTKSVSKIRQIEGIVDVDMSEVKQSNQIYGEVMQELKMLKTILDLFTYGLFCDTKQAKKYLKSKGSKGKVPIWDLLTLFGDPIAILESGMKIESDLRKVPLSTDDKELINKAIHFAQEKKIFHWPLEFPEIWYGSDNGSNDLGFDVVLGNPPYVDSERMKKRDPDIREYLCNYWKTPRGNWDLYIPFWELAIEKINSNGNAALITPNKWLSIGYGQALRDFAKSSVFLLSDFSSIKVFEDSGIFTIIAGMHKINCDSVEVRIFKDDYKLEHKQKVLKSVFDEFGNWGVAFSKNIPLLKKIRKNNQKLSNVSDVAEPFTVSEAYKLKEYVIKYSSTVKEYFKLVVTGTIDRYESLWGFETTKYLGKKYLKPIVSQKNLKKNFLRRYNQTIKPKIVISGIRYFESFLDISGIFLAGKSTVILENTRDQYALASILCALNSKLLTFYLKEVYSCLAMDEGINFTAPLVKELPIPKMTIKSYSAYSLNKLKKLFENNEYDLIWKAITSYRRDNIIMHDFLSYLSEKMIHLCRVQLVSKAFIEDKIMTGSDEKIEIITILQKMKKNLPSAESVQKTYAEKLLKQCEEKISKLDDLIDHIVCYFYGLSITAMNKIL